MAVPESAALAPDAPIAAAPARRSLARSGVVVGVAAAIGTALTVPFHLALVRLLSPAEYSLLASLFAVIVIFAVPTLALQASVAREVARLLAEGAGEEEVGRYLRDALRTIGRWLAGLAIAGACVAVPLAFAFDARDPVPLLATAVALAFTLPLPVLWGGLQGAERFEWLAALLLGYYALRLGAGVALAAAGAGVGGVMAGIAVATAATAGLSALPLRRALAGFARGAGVLRAPARRIFTGYAAGAAGILMLFAALTNVDLLVARIAFPASVAGAYAGASLGARSLLLVPVAVTTVLFPRVSVLRNRAQERSLLLAGIAVVGLIGGAATAFFAAFPHPILRTALGPAYLSASSWLAPLALAMTLYGIGNVYLFQFLSLGRTRFGLAVGGLFVVQVALYGAFHARPGELVAVQIGTAAALVVAGELYDRLGTRRRS